MASPLFAEVFGGNALLDGMEPYAANYGGHQFGQWAGQLGDGRAITLGEVLNASGQRWELQLKGAGPTPYARRADGRAVLRSSIREFLCSEAMHHLGVPTTRALSLVLTGDQVLRDMFYDGDAKLEPGAIVCRVAPSFIRFGNFQLPASRSDLPLLEPADRFHDPPGLPRAVCCAAAATVRAKSVRARVVRPGLRADRRDGCGLDAGRVRPRRDEHRQHVDPRPDDRLRTVRLDRRLRSGLDAEHDRCRRPPLPLRRAGADRLLEPRALRRSAGAGVRVAGSAACGNAAATSRSCRESRRTTSQPSSGSSGTRTRT